MDNEQKEIKRGDIFYVSCPEEVLGSEQRGRRPAVVVSNNMNNRYSTIVEVVYLTTQRKSPIPTHVQIQSLPRISTALCEQISSISVKRLGQRLGHCTPQEMECIDFALCISIGLDDGKVLRVPAGNEKERTIGA